MFPTFISILDIQSWWEVPSIAHFCSLFRTAFNLLDFDIEDLEEALLTDGTEESSWLQDLIVRLLSGCLPNNEISTFNYQMFLRRLFRQKCQEHDLYNPFNTDIDFQLLPLRTKVDILHALCDFRLDAEDVLDQLKNLEADSLRVEPLGYDGNDSAYWYFYGTRLYREDYTTKNNKKKAVWQVICFTEDDWLQLTKKLKKSGDKAERQLHLTLNENFLPELPRLFKEKENLARKRLLENLPRRTSSRLKKTEGDHEKEVEKKDNVKEEKLKREKEEEVKRKDLETRRQEAYERRSKLKDKVKDEDVEEESDKMSNTRSKKSKTKEKNNFKDEKSSKNSKHNKKREKSDNETKLSSSKPTTIGRQTNNSLSAVTGQILIEPPKNPNKKKLKTSQVFRQTDEDLQTGMHKILDFVKNHEDAWPFTDPVEEEYAPNYYSIVRKPMDLQRMEERLDSGYYKTFDKFRSDFKLIVDNCKLYNGAENEYTEMVDNLLRVFEKATVKYLDQISSSDDEIAIEFTGEENSKTKGKEKKSDEPSSNNVRRKPMLAAQTDRKRHRSESEGSIDDIVEEAPTRPNKIRKQDQSESEFSDTVNKGSKKMKKTKLVVKEKSVSKKSKLKRVAKKEKEKDKDKEKDRKKKVKSKPFSRSPSLSPPPSDSPPPSSPDSRFDYCPKSLGKRKQYEEFTDCDNSSKERQKLLDTFEEKKPKKPDPLIISPKPKDKHNKLRETIEKLKAKSEIKFNAEPDRPKENDKINVESENNTIDSVESKCSNTFAAKPASHMDALSIATEQTLKDINKWLDDTPKFAEFSSASNSPSYAGLEELDALANKLDPPPGKKPAAKKDAITGKEPAKKKPFRDPSKFFKRREIQRTIDRLQPGKSKGNLITNVPNANKTADEPFPLGPLAKLKDAKNSLIVKTDTNAPKLSLGSVLDSFGKHKFAEKEKAKPPEPDEAKAGGKAEEKEAVNADCKKDDEGSGATPNLSAWFKAFGAPKVQSVQPATKKNEAKEEKEEPQPVARQRRISTGSSVSERSSFSQDMDSPRVGMDERGAYPAPYPSPMHRSPSGASPVMASPRPDISPKASYSTINGQIRVGFYQDTVSNKSSPDKSCSPKENSQSQSPYPHYSEHIYTPNTTENSYYSPYYTHVPNYSSTNPTPPYNAEGNYYYEGSNKSVPNYTANSPASNQSSPAPAPSSVSPNPSAHSPNIYSPHSPTVLPQHSPTVLPQRSPSVLCSTPAEVEEEKMGDKAFPVKKRAYNEQEQPIANQRFEIDPRLTQQIELKKNSEQKEYVHQNIPDPKNHHHQHNNALQQEDLYYMQQHQNKMDMSKYTNMGYTGPDYPATSAISVPSTTQSKAASHDAHVRYANPNLVGYKNPVETGGCQSSATRSSANVARTMASTMANLSHIVDQFGGEERMMVGLQNMQNAGGFYADKGHLLNKPMANNAIFSQANMAALQSYNQSMQVSTASLYNRQMTDLQNQSIMQSELKANQQMHAVAEKKSKKRKASKNAVSMESQPQAVNHQGFQSYAGLKSANAALEPSAISLKTSSVVPGSAFNFGPTPTGLSGIYGDKDNYPNFLDDFRSAATSYYKESSRPAHQPANPQSYPFLGPPGPPPPAPQSRAAYQMAGPFMQNAQAQLMNTGSPLYQHYLQQAGVLNQGLLAPPPPPPPHGAYPPGYHPALSMRQPYDSMNRPPWL